MYRKKNREIQIEEVKISLEALVPEKHILRAIDKVIDKSFLSNICSESVQCVRR